MQGLLMRRRDFIGGLSSSMAWPMVVRAQQGERVRRVGILLYGAANDPSSEAHAAAIRGGLSKLGWTEGRNLRIDLRFVRGDVQTLRSDAEALVRLAPDVIVANTGPVTRAVQLTTRTIPIILVAVGDPVANGYVTNLARPEGNTTGYTNLFFSIAGKWVQLLKDVAPRLERVGFIYNSSFDMSGYWGEIETAGTKLGLLTARLPVGTESEIERAIETFAAEPNGALILTVQPNRALRDLIGQLAIRHRLPTIYNEKNSMPDEGLMSYGPSVEEIFGRGATFYVDRILRGAKVIDLPVQFATKFELVINLRTAKAIGIAIPGTLLATADEVIQ
jgi:putative tryptophan/tyrosine transport system substrate-binding protein